MDNFYSAGPAGSRPTIASHVLQGQRSVLVRLPFDDAVQRILTILSSNGSAKVTSSETHRVVVAGTWRTAVRVRYEATLSGPNTVVQFYSRRPSLLDSMLMHLVGQFDPLSASSPPQPAPARWRARHDVRLKFANYDGGLLFHPRPERRGSVTFLRATPTFVLGWRHVPRGTPKANRCDLARYSIELLEAGRSSHLVIRDRQDPRAVAQLDLPNVAPHTFDRMLHTKVRRHAATWRPMYRVANYNGGLPAHPRAEGFGTLVLVRRLWVLRFPRTKELFYGLISDDSLTVTKTGQNSCGVAITVPQILGGRATFDMPDTSAEAFSAELSTRQNLERVKRWPFYLLQAPAMVLLLALSGFGLFLIPYVIRTNRPPGLSALSGRETREVLKLTRLFEQDPSRAKASKPKAPSLAYLPLVGVIIGGAIGIPVAISASHSGSSPGAGISGDADTCPAGFGYFEIGTTNCYQGSGPGANNSAGNGIVPVCQAGYPYYNAGTDKCYTSIPGAGVGTRGGPSIDVNGNGSQRGGGGSGGGGGPSGCYACITITQYNVILTTGYARSYPSCFFATFAEPGSPQPIVGPQTRVNQSDRTWRRTWKITLPQTGDCTTSRCGCRTVDPPYLEAGAPVSLASYQESQTDGLSDGESFWLSVTFQGWAGNSYTGPLDIKVVNCTDIHRNC